MLEETPTKKEENKAPEKTPTTPGNPPSSKPNTQSKFWSRPGENSDSSDDLDASDEYDQSELLKRKAKFSPSLNSEDQFKLVRNQKKLKKKMKGSQSPTTTRDSEFVFSSVLI